MNCIIHKIGEMEIAEILSADVVIKSAQDFLDLMANVSARKIILKKEMLDDGFFNLKTGIAGEILQKVSNYRMKLAIVGDFSNYSSKSLRDFIFESNQGLQVIFVGTTEIALGMFAM